MPLKNFLKINYKSVIHQLEIISENVKKCMIFLQYPNVQEPSDYEQIIMNSSWPMEETRYYGVAVTSYAEKQLSNGSNIVDAL